MNTSLQMQYLIITVLTAYAFISCSQQDAFVKKLTNNDSLFWDEYDYKAGYVTGSFSFDSKGKCFYYTNKGGRRSKIYEDDVEYTHIWTHKGDSVLNINGFDRQILHFTDDTLILLNSKIKDTIVLIKGK